MICFNYLGDAVNHLIYPGSASNPSTISRTKTQRALSARNEFFMTLCRLRCGLLEQDLAFRFQISQSTVSRILTAILSIYTIYAIFSYDRPHPFTFACTMHG